MQFDYIVKPSLSKNSKIIMHFLRFSSPLTSTFGVVFLGSTLTVNGDLSTGFLSYVTSTLCGPVSVGMNEVVYPSGESFTGNSTVFFFGVVTVTLQGPLVFCFGVRI